MPRCAFGLAATLLLGCGTSTVSVSPSPPASPRCEPSLSIQRFEVPRFALEDGAMANWLGEDIVLMRVGRLVTASEPTPFDGAIYETCSSRWTTIPPPPSIPGGTGMNYQMRVVGTRVVLFYYGLSITNAPDRGAAIYDPRTRAWTTVAPDGAPEVAAFLTGPYREATTGDRWVWFPHRAPHGHVLDALRARWIPASSVGMPPASNTFFVRALPSGLVLVPSASEDVAGVFDPIANRWQAIPFVRLDADYASVVVAPSGTIAVLSWDPPSNGARNLRAWIVDPSTRTITPLPVTTTSTAPNAAYVHFDGERIVHIDVDRWHRHAEGRWTNGPLPLAPVHSGGAFGAVRGDRAHFAADHHWLVDTRTMSFHRVAWREDIPALGHLTLYDDARIAILGEVREVLHPRSCPPGAPCLPPERERIESTQSFLVPFR